MTTHVSERVQSLAPSATLAMSQKSNELKAAGVDVINLSVGEPDFETPRHIKEAAKKAIDDNFTFYTPVPGYMSLRKAVSEKLARENGVSYAPEQIVVANGAKQALCNVILASINPGDEVVIPMPAWVSYVEMVKLAGGVTVSVNADISQDFKITPAQLEQAITPATRMLLLCSPSNPTGSVYSRAELQALVDVLAKYPDVMVLADEIYEHINFTGESSIAQKAAEAAYTGSQECVREMNAAFERRRDLVVELASAIPGLKVNRPQGAFYLFPEVSAYIGKTTPDGREIASSADLAMYLLEHGHVATVDGGAFGMEGYIRLSYATSDDNLREAMARISRALSELK
ncbi:MAG: pyridoxal phosphate-dependent aminotransferase [Muribaculaceae bacterium]|nr:pyridoxal phosphate-dependent aminotransferase [Muribaculaceae bacterium]